jgi:hypothetical protein
MDTLETIYSSSYYNQDMNKKREKSDAKSEASVPVKSDEQILQDITKTNTENNEKIAPSKPVTNKPPILDPLSVIIKLAILSNKPVGAKLFIKENVVHIQEPGIFQGVSRYLFHTTKEDLQYLYNPIYLACKQYLNKDARKRNPKMVDLFICAQRGIIQLSETYKHNALIRLCLNYYYVLMDNYVKEMYWSVLFREDEMTKSYTEQVLFQLNELWTTEKIKIVLDMICFLNDDVMANENVKSLDIFIQNVDKHTSRILQM